VAAREAWLPLTRSTTETLPTQNAPRLRFAVTAGSSHGHQTDLADLAETLGGASLRAGTLLLGIGLI
jgi:hypothetical protein